MIKQFPFKHVFLVGIKGVAMTSLAQILVDAGYQVSGSDVAEDFVTAEQLKKLALHIQNDFTGAIPDTIDAVIYTAAHNGAQNNQVVEAKKRNVPIFSQAEAISFFANSKQCIAVCGVGGKSTVSAMITWILEWNKLHPSFSVGVGNILNLDKTGGWRSDGKHFVVEADEYVTNPEAVRSGSPGVPRFSYLKPQHIVATNISFDHPDVYTDFAHTKTTYAGFFSKLPRTGNLILTQQVLDLELPLPNCNIITVSTEHSAEYRYTYLSEKSRAGRSLAQLHISGTTYTIELKLPGEYNMQNAVCAIAATACVGVSVQHAIQALAHFRSTQRRFEEKFTLHNTTFYDDYAHHPSELSAVITALREWYPDKQLVLAFQPHTFSRTRSLLTEFAQSIALADRVVLLEIFASARESLDPSMNSAELAAKVRAISPEIPIQVLPNNTALAEYFKTALPANAVVLTAGAGDIYQVYDELTAN